MWLINKPNASGWQTQGLEQYTKALIELGYDNLDYLRDAAHAQWLVPADFSGVTARDFHCSPMLLMHALYLRLVPLVTCVLLGRVCILRRAVQTVQLLQGNRTSQSSQILRKGLQAKG